MAFFDIIFYVFILPKTKDNKPRKSSHRVLTLIWNYYESVHRMYGALLSGIPSENGLRCHLKRYEFERASIRNLFKKPYAHIQANVAVGEQQNPSNSA